MDTIFALSSGAPPAAIAIVRLSGPLAFDSVRRLAGTLPACRTAGLRVLRDPDDGTVLDRGLVLAFDGPATATGEDVVELHVHGGRAVTMAIERVLGRMSGLRHAEPGEFTRRALTHGVIDLTEAEGLGDLLAAETEAQRVAALRMAEGGLRALVEGWTTRAVHIAAAVEAMIDFGEEDDVAGASLGPVVNDMTALADELAAMLDRPAVERLKDGVRIVLAGPPNSGKSTLLNALAERDVAIVSPVSGTTRDRIEVPVVRNGIAYLLTDTAGLAERSDDPVERIGIARARQAMAAADVVLWLGDERPADGALWLYPRADLPGRGTALEDRLVFSARTGIGMDTLWACIEGHTRTLLPASREVTTNRRQRELLEECVENLQAARNSADLVLAAEHIRIARGALDRISGRADVEAVLDAIFSRFCLGK